MISLGRSPPIMATRANTMAAEQTIDRTAHAQAHERLRPSFDEIRRQSRSIAGHRSMNRSSSTREKKPDGGSVTGLPMLATVHQATTGIKLMPTASESTCGMINLYKALIASR